MVMVLGLFCSAGQVQAQVLNSGWSDWQRIKEWAISGEDRDGIKVCRWTDGFQLYIFYYKKSSGRIGLEGISNKGNFRIIIEEHSGKYLENTESAEEAKMYVKFAVTMVLNRPDGFKLAKELNRKYQELLIKEKEKSAY